MYSDVPIESCGNTLLQKGDLEIIFLVLAVSYVQGQQYYHKILIEKCYCRECRIDRYITKIFRLRNSMLQLLLVHHEQACSQTALLLCVQKTLVSSLIINIDVFINIKVHNSQDYYGSIYFNQITRNNASELNTMHIRLNNIPVYFEMISKNLLSTAG